MNLAERIAAVEGSEPPAKPAAKTTKTPSSTATKTAASTTRSGVPAQRPGARRAELPLGALAALKTQVRTAAVATLGPSLASGAVDEVKLRKELETQLAEALRHSSVAVPPSERNAFLDEMIEDMLGWGALTPLLSDPSVTEVMCNSANEIWVERKGKIVRSDVHFPTEAAYRQVIDRMLAGVGRRVDEACPMADGRLPDGSRINVVIPPLSLKGPSLTIRRFPEVALSVADLIRMESISADAAVFLEACVRGKANMVVSGGTGTGKTTMLGVLATYIPGDERLITIEDAAELRLQQDHVVTLEARPPNIEGAGEVSIRDLVRNALRMRPDRIVVGEVRDSAALDMLQAMNTGHEGSLTTIHANSARDALSRIETMVLFSGLDLPLRAIREQVASALDIVVQLERLADGRRVVSAITEVQGREGDTITLQDIYKRVGDGALHATGLRPALVEKLGERGVTMPATHFRAKGPTAMSGSDTGLRRRR